ncbi:MAG TPA: hypothetical protein VNA25_04400, partial [Phycisphaerae bacterium]|nr:hypothetical protein [Phycisphaerae bacterium]
MRTNEIASRMIDGLISQLKSEGNLPITSITLVGSASVGKISDARPEIDVLVFLERFDPLYFLALGDAIRSFGERSEGFHLICGTLESVWRVRAG